MPNMQSVTIVGHAGRDAEIKTSGDKSWATFSIAVTENQKDTKETTWYRCSVWGRGAQKAVELIKKGDTVLVQGKQRWTKTGIDVTASEWKLLKSKYIGDPDPQLASTVPSNTDDLDLPF